MALGKSLAFAAWSVFGCLQPLPDLVLVLPPLGFLLLAG
jgi:hypothetical protein